MRPLTLARDRKEMAKKETKAEKRRDGRTQEREWRFLRVVELTVDRSALVRGVCPLLGRVVTASVVWGASLRYVFGSSQGLRGVGGDEFDTPLGDTQGEGG